MWDPSFMLKSYGVVVVVVVGGLQDFSVSPGSESTEPESLSLSHWAWVWAWLSLSLSLTIFRYFYDECSMHLIHQMLLSCHICRPQYLPSSGVASLAGIVYGLSSSNCLCSLSLTINEPNYKLQTTNKPQGRKYTIFTQNFSSTRYHCCNEAAIEVLNSVCLYWNWTLPLKF